MSENISKATTDKGVVRSVLSEKGMGFITCTEGPDAVFFRRSNPGFSEFSVGDAVAFHRQDMTKARESNPQRLDVAHCVRFAKSAAA